MHPHNLKQQFIQHLKQSHADATISTNLSTDICFKNPVTPKVVTTWMQNLPPQSGRDHSRKTPSLNQNLRYNLKHMLVPRVLSAGFYNVHQPYSGLLIHSSSPFRNTTCSNLRIHHLIPNYLPVLP